MTKTYWYSGSLISFGMHCLNHSHTTAFKVWDASKQLDSQVEKLAMSSFQRMPIFFLLTPTSFSSCLARWLQHGLCLSCVLGLSWAVPLSSDTNITFSSLGALEDSHHWALCPMPDLGDGGQDFKRKTWRQIIQFHRPCFLRDPCRKTNEEH